MKYKKENKEGNYEKITVHLVDEGLKFEYIKSYDNFICSKCSYNNCCEDLSVPGKYKTLYGVCKNMFINGYPVEKTWENSINGAKRSLREEVISNKYVKLSEVVDTVCKDICLFYDKDYSLCDNNEFCLFKDLIK